MTVCDRCGGELSNVLAVKVAQLVAKCERVRIAMTEDFMVIEADAATLLQRSAGGLRNWRSYSNPPPLLHVMRDRRAYYALAELAAFIIARSDPGDGGAGA